MSQDNDGTETTDEGVQSPEGESENNELSEEELKTLKEKAQAFDEISPKFKKLEKKEFDYRKLERKVKTLESSSSGTTGKEKEEIDDEADEAKEQLQEIQKEIEALKTDKKENFIKSNIDKYAQGDEEFAKKIREKFDSRYSDLDSNEDILSNIEDAAIIMRAKIEHFNPLNMVSSSAGEAIMPSSNKGSFMESPQGQELWKGMYSSA